MKRLRWFIACIGVLVVIAIVVVVYFKYYSSAGTGSLPLTVSITNLERGGAYPVMGGIPVRAQAISSEPISRLEFWADGQLVDSETAPINNLYVYAHTWTWTPTTLGDHTLTVRAFDARGENSPTSVINITAVPDPGILLMVTPAPGDTLNSLADQYHTSIDAILAANQTLKSTDPIPAEIFIPLSPSSAASQTSGIQANSPSSTKIPIAGNGTDLSFINWVRMEVINPITGIFAPKAPSLSASANECNVTLTINDQANNENGFYVYRLDPQTSDFVKIATLPSHTGSDPLQFTDKNLLGSFQYYVSAYDNAGEGASNFIGVTVSGDSCSDVADTFALAQLVNLDPASMDKTYLYISVNQGEWSRIPQDPNTFLSPDAIINLGKTASILAVKTTQVLSVRGEVWGWSGRTLAFLGSFNKNIKPPPQPLAVQNFVLSSTTLHVQATNPVVDAQPHLIFVNNKSIVAYGSELFEWTTGSDTATRGQWQISTLPFSNNLDLNPPGLVLTGEAPISQKEKFIQFPIDLGPLNPIKAQNPTAQMGNQPVLQTSSIPHIPPFAPPYNPVNQGFDPIQMLLKLFGLPTFNQVSAVPSFWLISPANSNNQNSSGSPSGILPPGLFIRYYVRALPMKGNDAVGDPSNMVILDYYWQSGYFSITLPAPQAQPYDLTITDFQPLHFSKSHYAYCVTVVTNPYYKSTDISKLYWSVINPNDPGSNTICPKPWAGEDKSLLGQIVDVFKEALNKISDLYNALSDFVVDLVAKLNPACLGADWALTAANQGTSTVDDVCHYVAKVAVEAAKAYVGLPPSIPNFDQLEGMGVDYLTDQAAQQMEAAGIPCPDKCKELIKQGIQASFDEVQSSLSNSICWNQDQAHQLGFEDGICVPDGVKTVPDPRGQYYDGIATVQITRKPGFQDSDIPEFCTLSVIGNANNYFWIGKSLGLEGPDRTTQEYMSWQGTQISGMAITNRNAISIPKLLGNQDSISIPVLMTRNSAPYWIPGHEKVWQGIVPGLNEDDWAYLYHGSTLDVTASSLCSGQPSNTWQAGPVVGPFEDLPVK